MSRRHEIDVRAHSTAPPAVVYALLTDGASWPHWSPMVTFGLERPGDGGGEEVGAIRVFRSRWAVSRERVVELRPDRRLSYTLLSGIPVRDYRADVDLEPSDDGTTIRWHSTFAAKVPGTGWFYRRILGGFVRACAQGLADHSGALHKSASA
ncbi:SRPBCC family protein [Actinopolymorpha sp. B11F2]|uniref:SRPBCC family protein n=1 Tax=Actinopolymorpha sp. B11F2 TaxID=3160862 RepID=UPI0032E4F20A